MKLFTKNADFRQLPWSTSNEDLVELFTTIGKVERAEIQYEPNGRSRGTGVVEFGSADDAETAIGKLESGPYCLCSMLTGIKSQVHGLPVRRSPSRPVLRQVHQPRKRRHHGYGRFRPGSYVTQHPLPFQLVFNIFSNTLSNPFAALNYWITSRTVC